jgi:hypothetical protein
MSKREKPARERQIEVMAGASQRQDDFARRWIAKPDFKAALHRRNDARASRKKVAG